MDTNVFPRPLEIYRTLCGLARGSNIFDQIWGLGGHAASITLWYSRLPGDVVVRAGGGAKARST